MTNLIRAAAEEADRLLAMHATAVDELVGALQVRRALDHATIATAIGVQPAKPCATLPIRCIGTGSGRARRATRTKRIGAHPNERKLIMTNTSAAFPAPQQQFQQGQPQQMPTQPMQGQAQQPKQREAPDHAVRIRPRQSHRRPGAALHPEQQARRELHDRVDRARP